MVYLVSISDFFKYKKVDVMLIEPRTAWTYVNGKPLCQTCVFFFKDTFNPVTRAFKCALDRVTHHLTKKGFPTHHCPVIKTHGECITCQYFQKKKCYAKTPVLSIVDPTMYCFRREDFLRRYSCYQRNYSTRKKK